jgi:hypothetical protein
MFNLMSGKQQNVAEVQVCGWMWYRYCCVR